jgi:hypothetical protein
MVNDDVGHDNEPIGLFDFVVIEFRAKFGERYFDGLHLSRQFNVLKLMTGSDVADHLAIARFPGAGS